MSYVPEQKMYSTDVATIAAGVTYTTDSDIIEVWRVRRLALQVYFTGDNVASAGTITFNISVSLDGTTWSTIPIPITAQLNGTTKVVGEAWLWDVDGIHSIKVDSIINGDASQAVDTLNVIIRSQG